MVRRLGAGDQPWELVIIGGGATGLGAAVDAASRGYRTLLLEQHDFAKGTSSRSTKLVHGGVRYLRQGNIPLVMEALKERGILRNNAPHLVHDLQFVVPNYDWWEAPFYGIGMKVYDILAGKHGFGRSRKLSRARTLEHIPTIETKGLRGGVLYYDGQFDDARLAINLAQTAAAQGATLINYMRVTDVMKSDGMSDGVVAVDLETGERYEARARAVINATGVYADQVRRMDDPEARSMISPSQGVHIVLDGSFLPGNSAIMVPHTDDGRVLFAIPWHERVIVGTTDTPVEDIPLEPQPLEEELNFLLEHTARYLTKDPSRADVLSAFAGLRPLVSARSDQDTSALSRDHTITISRSGMITIAGGKWTTYRKMAEDLIDQASTLAQLDERPCVTRNLNIHGFHRNAEEFGTLKIYGADAPAIEDMIREDPRLGDLLHPDRPTVAAEVVWAVRHEMARTVEDVLARRTRNLLLDARKSLEMAPLVARIIAEELQKESSWIDDQLMEYETLVRGYVLDSP